ncbi:MAG: sugar ABC transporter permease [Clostridiales bacterium]|nr:sugar ABC transporter permease [Clostridiales bacterium]
MSEATVRQARSGAFNKKNRNKLIFYSIFISIPILHFLIFYLYVNFNSIILAFRGYEIDFLGEISSKFAKFDNFKEAWSVLFNDPNNRLLNSVIYLVVGLFVSTPLALSFSFYIYKKRFGSVFFRIILFLPQILSTVIMGIIYKNLTNFAYFGIMENLFNIKPSASLLDNINTRMATIIVFSVIMSFGVNVLTYTSTMSGINDSLIESAQLDGAKPIQELIHIVLPLIYPTITTLIIVRISYTFVEQAHIFTLIGPYEPATGSTIGYFLYLEAKYGDLIQGNVHLSYPVLSAIGLILTAIILPITLLTRYLFNKFGPKVD